MLNNQMVYRPVNKSYEGHVYQSPVEDAAASSGKL